MTITQKAILRCYEWMRAICPYDTGNMHNTISVVQAGEDTWEVHINPNGTAPYAVFTNEKWIDRKWNGAHNPNEKWIDRGVKEFVQYFTWENHGEYASDGEQERWENKNYYASIADGG